jgi:hypothetical protein
MPLPDPATEVTEQAAATARDQFVVAVLAHGNYILSPYGTLPRTLEDDAAAEALAVRLWARLKGEDEGGVAGAEGDAGPKLLTNTEPDPEATL